MQLSQCENQCRGCNVRTGPPAPPILPRPTKFQVPEADVAVTFGASVIFSMCFASSARTWATSELRIARRSCIRETTKARMLRRLSRRESGRVSSSFVVISAMCRSRSTRAALSARVRNPLAQQRWRGSRLRAPVLPCGAASAPVPRLDCPKPSLLQARIFQGRTRRPLAALSARAIR